MARTPQNEVGFDAAAAERDFVSLAELFMADERVTGGRLFGSEGLKVNGKFFAMVVRGDLVVKLPQSRVANLLAAGTATRFDPGHGRVMKEWLAVDAASTDDWLSLAREALKFVADGSR